MRKSFYRAFLYLVLIVSIILSLGFFIPRASGAPLTEAIRFLSPYAYQVNVYVILENIGNATATSGYVDLPIPQSNPPFLFIKDVTFSPEIPKNMDDGHDSILGRVNFSNVKAGEQFEIAYSYKYQTYNYIIKKHDLEISDYSIEDEDLKYFTEPQPLVESDSPEIIEIGEYLSAKSTNIFDLTKEIKAYMRENIKYERSYNGENGALWALNEGRGDCSEFSAVFTAIMRSLGIPTRIVTGFMAEDYPQTTAEISYIETLHAIVEIYIPGIGWVPNEPQELDEIEFLPGKTVITSMENLTDPNYLVLIEDQNYQLKDHGGFWYYYDDVNNPAEIQFSKESYVVITPIETWAEEVMPEIWVDNSPPEIEITGLSDKYDAETNLVNMEILV
ncbi:MAG: transglutaminase-like domain-containing protein, partial [Actinobacteria bacterium]|nr:transglutaminase-like domain-containing protein [Actinomycetota bacterium]